MSLDDLDHKLASMFDLVADSLTMLIATSGAAWPATVAALAERDKLVDALRDDVERIVQFDLARQQAMGSDLRLLMTAIHIAPELERSHDLVVHAARDAGLVVGACTERQAAFAAMADQAAAMWRSVAAAYRRRDTRAAAELEKQDTRMDDLQRSVLASLGTDALEPRSAVNLALLARFYERLGDHAVHLAKRIRFMVLGESGEAD